VPSERRDAASSLQWWRHAVIYQVYLKSFVDASDDGVGDIKGLISGLPYLTRLGVDALWVTPWFPSPMRDGGYDVSDYRGIDPVFGTLDDAEQLIAACHERGVRLVLDLVANHCSREHPWFTSALAAAEGSQERRRFYFLDGRGDHGEIPPTDWNSVFGGPAWTRTRNIDGSPGQWYLHLFDPSQPDLNWGNEEVGAEFDDILRFWFDRGIDGFRLDAIPAIGKDDDFRDVGLDPDERFVPEHWGPTPFWDADGVHDVLKRWRRVAREYEPERFFVGEVVVSSTESLARYIRHDELPSVFSIDLAKLTWHAADFQRTITQIMDSQPPGGSWLTWTLASHDETRTVTRYAPLVHGEGSRRRDLDTGRRRSRAAYLLVFALPGAACLYQGEEMGLAQVEDIPDDVMQDPIFFRTGERDLSRDGCRVPLPWTSDAPSWGFSRSAPPWLPQPTDWSRAGALDQLADELSFVSFMAALLGVRSQLGPTLSVDVQWESAPPGVVILRRGPSFRCVVNFSGEPWRLEARDRVLVATSPLDAHRVIAANNAAWLTRDS
jgi:alpha-glucosidase